MLHIDIPSLAEFKALAAARNDACVSVYVPTSPAPEDAERNRVAFEDLAKSALAGLEAAGLPKRRIWPIADQFRHLSGIILETTDDNKFRYRDHDPLEEVDEFWRTGTNGLALLTTPEMTRTFRLPDHPKPLAKVADRFHLTPLIRAMTSPHDVLVLALSVNRARLLHAFVNLPPVEIQIPDLPRNAEEATRRPSVHVRAPRRGLQNLEGEKTLLHKYARLVAQALRGVLTGRDTPMVLAADEPLATLYRSVNPYPRLLDTGIPGNPDHATDAELADAALPILNRVYKRELQATLARFDELKPRRATADLARMARAATFGAVHELAVDLDAVIPGRVDDTDGSVAYAPMDDATTYSVVDEVARRALDTGARVLGARSDELPHAPAIAVLRYAFDWLE